MLLLWKILSIILALQNVHCTTRDTLALEMSYQEKIMLPGLKLVCPPEKLRFARCQELFDRAHYRYEVKVFPNQQRFLLRKLKCTKKHLTFTAIPGPTVAHSQNMFTCFGRHEPVRTSPIIDDFARAFLLAASPDPTLFYVFRSRKLGRNFEYFLYEEITDMAPNILAREPFPADLVREKLLQTGRTDNLWIPDIQRIYLNEVVIPQKPIQNRLQGIKPQHLYFICLYTLRDAKFKDPAFVVDVQRIEAWDGQPLPMDLYFDFEDPKYIPFSQFAYPCYGRHEGGMPIENRKFLNLYRISSGFYKNTLVVYHHVGPERAYRVLAIYENLDLRGIETPPSAWVSADQITGQPETGLQVTSQQMANLQLASSARGPLAPPRLAAQLAIPTTGVPGQDAGQLDPWVFAYPSATPDPRQLAGVPGFYNAQFHTPPEESSYASGYSAPGLSYDPGPYLQPGSSFDPGPYLQPGSSFDPGPYLQMGSSFDPGPYLQPGSSFDPGSYLQLGPSYATGSYGPQLTSVEAGASSSYIPYQPYALAPYPQVGAQAGPSSSGMQPQFPSQSEESYRSQLPDQFSQEQALPYIIGQNSEPQDEFGDPYYIGNPSLQQQELFGGSYYPQGMSTADEFDPFQTSNPQESEEEEALQEIIKSLAEPYPKRGPEYD